MQSALVIAIIDALEAESVPYMLAGSMASMVYGMPRSTKDVDFVIEVEEASFAKLIKRVNHLFELDPQQHLETLTWTRRYILNSREPGFKVELFIKSHDPHHLVQWQRKVFIFNALVGKEVWMPTAEDVVVQKVRWGRPQDRVDAQYVIGVQGGALDMTYIRKWCDQHGTAQRLNEILAGLPAL
jgi:hypothetical protein